MQQFEQDDLLPMLRQHPLDLAVAKNADDMRRVLPGAELLIANNRVYNEEIGRVVLALGKDLRWIQYSTAGIERGIRFGMPRGIPVCAASGIKGPTVAEHAMLLLLASFRRMREIEHARGQARLDPRPDARDRAHAGRRDAGRRRLRRHRPADRAQGQGLRHARDRGHAAPAGRGRPWTRRCRASACTTCCRSADAVVLCLPVEPDTIRLFGDAEFARMKPDALFINVGRGELVDEDALVRALKRAASAARRSTSRRSSRCRRKARCGRSTTC